MKEVFKSEITDTAHLDTYSRGVYIADGLLISIFGDQIIPDEREDNRISIIHNLSNKDLAAELRLIAEELDGTE